MGITTAAGAPGSSKYRASGLRRWIVGMWAFYAVSLVISVLGHSLATLVVSTMLCMLSFGVAVYLLFQRNEVGRLHGGIKLLWDLGVAFVIVFLLLRSGMLFTLLPTLTGR